MHRIDIPHVIYTAGEGCLVLASQNNYTFDNTQTIIVISACKCVVQLGVVGNVLYIVYKP